MDAFIDILRILVEIFREYPFSCILTVITAVAWAIFLFGALKYVNHPDGRH
ncbi:MAG: hypothetical protein LUI04_07285 [Porphyromonadaceae bacterium]|nr:hypothetical protein [Porphyromonadaceae bacterium]